jgi:hypothetical protein
LNRFLKQKILVPSTILLASTMTIQTHNHGRRIIKYHQHNNNWRQNPIFLGPISLIHVWQKYPLSELMKNLTRWEKSGQLSNSNPKIFLNGIEWVEFKKMRESQRELKESSKNAVGRCLIVG